MSDHSPLLPPAGPSQPPPPYAPPAGQVLATDPAEGVPAGSAYKYPPGEYIYVFCVCVCVDACVQLRTHASILPVILKILLVLAKE